MSQHRKISMRGKGIDKRLEQDACEAYKWVGGEEDVVPENLVGCRFMIKGKMGKGKKITFPPHS